MCNQCAIHVQSMCKECALKSAIKHDQLTGAGASDHFGVCLLLCRSISQTVGLPFYRQGLHTYTARITVYMSTHHEAKRECTRMRRGMGRVHLYASVLSAQRLHLRLPARDLFRQLLRYRQHRLRLRRPLLVILPEPRAEVRGHVRDPSFLLPWQSTVPGVLLIDCRVIAE